MFSIDKFNTLMPYSEFKYHFYPDLHENCWNVVEVDGVVASISVEDPEKFIVSSGVVDIDLDILTYFRKFQQRPEYKLLQFEVANSLEDLQDLYEELFTGAIFQRAISNRKDPDSYWPAVERTLNWLRTTDFYTAPASSRFHECFEGGLCFHSIKVAKRTVELMRTNKFQDESRLGSALLCALTHDWCKIGLYESYMKNVKDEITGTWKKEKSFRYKGNSMINLGHGVSSMFLVSKFFKLSLEEASAIRWHMGAYRTDDNEFNELQTSNELYPLCYLIQFADQLSLVKY